MKAVTKADFDFSKAALYRKVEGLPKSRIEVAMSRQSVETVINGRLETQNTAEIGDYIITGNHKGRYVIARDDFMRLYILNPQNPDEFIHKAVRRVLFLEYDCEFQTQWGEIQYIPAGGVVVEDGEHIHGIPSPSFENKNARVDNAPEHNIFALMTEPLEIQLQKAQALDLPNHIADILKRISFNGHTNEN